jgi:hypothetical protein
MLSKSRYPEILCRCINYLYVSMFWQDTGHIMLQKLRWCKNIHKYGTIMQIHGEKIQKHEASRYYVALI